MTAPEPTISTDLRAVDEEPFEPDHDLVIKVAKHISTLSDYTSTEAVFIAYGVLIYLNDELGVEVPEASNATAASKTTEINPRDLTQLRRHWQQIAIDPADFRSDRTAAVVLALLDEIDRFRALSSDGQGAS